MKNTNHLELPPFGFYQENEIESLITKSNCFFLTQIYLEKQAKLEPIKSELKKNSFQLKKLSAITLSKTQNVFVKNSPWIPVTNSNFLIYTTKTISDSKIDAVLKNLIPLIMKEQILPVFFKKDLIVFDTHRLLSYNKSLVSLNKKAEGFALFLKNQVCLPVLPYGIVMLRNFFFLLKQLKENPQQK